MISGDKKRQALPSIRGYNYQFWKTIYEWVELSQGETIYIECGEDLDIERSNGSVTSVQVKNIRKNISLRDKDVIEAINNYWSLSKGNKRKNINYIFWTTANPTKEKGSPFDGEPGLEVWNMAKRNLEYISSLKEFFLEENKLNTEIIEFLKDTKNEVIQYQLIEPISWLMGMEDNVELEELIEEQLIHYGDRLDRGAHVSKSVLPKLFITVAQKAALEDVKDRELKKSDFLEIFDTETSEIVPRNIARKLYTQGFSQQQFSSLPLQALIGSDDQEINLDVKEETDEDLQMLLEDVYYREDIVSDIVYDLNKKGFVILSGSSGIGKSLLAKMVGINIGDIKSWEWVSFSRKEINEVEIILRKILQKLSLNNAKKNFIFDDLNLKSGNYKKVEQIFHFLVFKIVQKGGYLIVTTKDTVASILLSNLSVTKFDIPAFSSEEIANFIQQNSCPQDIVHDLSKLLELQTKGHPQLLHARVKSLASKDWKIDNIKKLFSQTEDIKNVQSEARDILFEELNTEQRVLLYALSILGGRFSRNQVLNLGDKIEEVRMPGEILDTLIGPWIEVESEDMYRISPLLEGCGEDIWGDQKIRDIRTKVIDSIFENEVLSIFDAEKILIHSFRNGDGEKFAKITVGLLTNIPEGTWNKVAQHLSWIIYIKESDLRGSFSAGSYPHYICRTLQFKIANVVDKVRANEIINNWEVATPKSKAIKDLFNRSFIIIQYLVYPHVQIDGKKSVELLEELANNLQLIKDSKDERAKSLLEFFSSLSKSQNNILQFLSAAIGYKINDAKELDSLIEGLKDSSQHLIKEFINGFEDNTIALKSFSNFWSNESTKENSNWDKCVRTYQKAINFFESQGAKKHQIYLSIGLATVLDEYLDKEEQALDIINNLLKQYDDTNLRDKKAVIYFNEKKYQAAVEIWDTILPLYKDESEEQDTDPIFAYRRAAISKAKLNNWQAAEKYFRESQSIAERLEIKHYQCGLLGDIAFACFKQGNNEAVLNNYYRAVNLLEELPDIDNDLDSFTVYRMLGHSIMWVKNQLVDQAELPGQFVEPFPGNCSNFERNEDLRELPDAPKEFIWYMLFEIEREVGVELGIKEKYFSLDLDQYLGLAFLNIGKTIEDQMLKKDLNDLPILLEQAEKAFRASQYYQNNNKPITEKKTYDQVINIEEFTYGNLSSNIIFFSLLIYIHEDKKFVSKQLEKWKSQTSKILAGSDLENLFNSIQDILMFSVSEAKRNILDPTSRQKLKLFSAVSLLLKDSIKAEHLYIACLTTLQHIINLNGYLKKGYSIHICELFVERWLTMVENRFLINMPNLTIPKIKSACNSDKDHIQKASEILLIAKDAVSVNVPESSVESLKRVANHGL